MLGVHVHLTDDDAGRALLVYDIDERLMLPDFSSVSKQSENIGRDACVLNGRYCASTRPCRTPDIMRQC